MNSDPALDPSTEYRKRLGERRDSLARKLGRVRALRYAREGALLLIPVTLYLAFVLHLFSAWFAVAPGFAFVALAIRYESVFRTQRRAFRAVAFYELGLARIEHRWMGAGNTDASFAGAAHLYAADLDIFGRGSLFELLSTVRTQSGRETLARWLCSPASRSEILKRQEAIEELRNNLALREDLAVLGPDRESIDFNRMAEWALASSALESRTARGAALVLVAITVGALINSWWFGGSAWLLACAGAAQIGFALRHRKHVREVIADIDEPAGELSVLYIPLARIDGETFSSAKLRELRARLETTGRAPTSRLGRLIGFVVLLGYRRNPSVGPFCPLFMWSTQLAFAIEAWRRRYGPFLPPWVEVVGEFEALCALAGYAFEHPEDRFPEIVEGPALFEAEDLRHPLLMLSECIPNSVRLGGELRLMVVSGSNMSGKSTLLRTIGINAVLAQAGAPVRAAKLRLSPLAIGATLRVQDSLESGTSQFYAEIRRLNGIIELTNGTMPVLFLLDEILHGTNSHDRLIGADAVLQELVDGGAIGLVTTHDLALAAVADALAPRAINVHFQDRIENGLMVFDYLLHRGVVQKSNALELMRAVGLKLRYRLPGSPWVVNS